MLGHGMTVSIVYTPITFIVHPCCRTYVPPRKHFFVKTNLYWLTLSFYLGGDVCERSIFNVQISIYGIAGSSRGVVAGDLEVNAIPPMHVICSPSRPSHDCHKPVVLWWHLTVVVTLVLVSRLV
jgi:hypothetical protein